ncbi:hypothetical protein EYC80_001163 [Monilinia laxa]|uniref:Uncharacterized protein n=1 Tax=Monilinia laxa TaxID=61186 RepID=A0A5N6K8A6_MONLA|nr:hypothetical protein EYC80_001163 [Monilinia laxa]
MSAIQKIMFALLFVALVLPINALGAVGGHVIRGVEWSKETASTSCTDMSNMPTAYPVETLVPTTIATIVSSSSVETLVPIIVSTTSATAPAAYVSSGTTETLKPITTSIAVTNTNTATSIVTSVESTSSLVTLVPLNPTSASGSPSPSATITSGTYTNVTTPSLTLTTITSGQSSSAISGKSSTKTAPASSSSANAPATVPAAGGAMEANKLSTGLMVAALQLLMRYHRYSFISGLSHMGFLVKLNGFVYPESSISIGRREIQTQSHLTNW